MWVYFHKTWNLTSFTMDAKTSWTTSWDAIFSPPWLVKVLNKLGVACIVLNTSQTPTLESIEWPTPSFNSLALNMLDELTTTTIAKAHCFYLSTFANISYIPLTFGDEELELFPIELEPWFENEDMIFKWEILQLSEKWKKIKMTAKCSHLYSYHP